MDGKIESLEIIEKFGYDRIKPLIPVIGKSK